MNKITRYNEKGTKVELDHKNLIELLEKTATENNDCEFIHTEKGRLVIFNPDRFVWNAFGKDSVDTENWLTDEQWHDFISSEDYLYLELEDRGDYELSQYCKENNIKEVYD